MTPVEQATTEESSAIQTGAAKMSNLTKKQRNKNIKAGLKGLLAAVLLWVVIWLMWLLQLNIIPTPF